MSLTTSEMTPADIAAVTGNRNNDGWGGDSGWWIILFLILAMGGNWGNGFGGGNNGFNGAVPWIAANDTQRGFDQSAIMSGINGLTSDVCNGFSGVQQALCNGFAGVNQNVSNGFAQAEIADNARQMANMNQNFAMQTAITGGLTNLSEQFANCCCENRLGLADLKYTVATENCADRQALNEGVRDIIANQTAGIQTILDKLCQQEIDALKTENANLQTQINLANLAASQTAQTAQLLADNSKQTSALEQYLNPAPIPAYVVQNPNCCTSTCGCNSGCGGF